LRPSINSIRAQIEKYRELGFSVIWLRSKVAPYRWKEFILTDENIGQYMKPGVNWGLRTCQLKCGLWFYVVDLDNKALLSDLYEHCPATLEAPVVSTSKGFHIYLSWTDEVKTKHVPSVDIIGNGYVVCPPSRHPSGKRYRFVKGMVRIPPVVDPQSVWAYVVECMEPSTTPPLPVVNSGVPTGNALKSYPHSLKALIDNGVPDGQRHNTLLSYLGAMHRSCFSEEEALSRVLAWNVKNKPPIPK
jgi:hypothetical protein